MTNMNVPGNSSGSQDASGKMRWQAPGWDYVEPHTVGTLVWTCILGCLCWAHDLEKTGGPDCSVLLFLDHLCKSQIVPQTSRVTDFSWD